MFLDPIAVGLVLLGVAFVVVTVVGLSEVPPALPPSPSEPESLSATTPEAASVDQTEPLASPASRSPAPPAEATETSPTATPAPPSHETKTAEPAEPAPEEPAAEPVAPRSLEAGLSKTRKGFMSRLNDLLFGSQVDEDLLEEMEALLVTSDLGVKTTHRLLDAVRDSKASQGDQVRDLLKTEVRKILNLSCPPLPLDQKPLVLMVIGVNGVGKTTTIGKLSAQFEQEGRRVLLGAGDTFRAAAVEQLQVWGERSKAEVVRGPDKADPSSVIYEAVLRSRKEDFDVCICDTAGRLHTKVNLMEELKKVRRTMDKAHPGAPHEVMLVLDATTGQNAISQAKQFKEAVDVHSIALTKLDGTAKGGVVVAICDELQIPVRYVGIGEGIEDLRPFDPDAFVDALFERN